MGVERRKENEIDPRNTVIESERREPGARAGAGAGAGRRRRRMNTAG